jgi:membrane-anchored protein YejM (alkaline phosphatase superfamily)
MSITSPFIAQDYQAKINSAESLNKPLFQKSVEVRLPEDDPHAYLSALNITFFYEAI